MNFTGICIASETPLNPCVSPQVVGSTYQILGTPNNATYIGSGKVAEVARAVRAFDVETVIFDDELSPGQVGRGLETSGLCLPCR